MVEDKNQWLYRRFEIHEVFTSLLLIMTYSIYSMVQIHRAREDWILRTTAITNQSVKLLVSTAQRIRILELSGTRKINDEGINYLISGIQDPHILVDLNLNWLTNVSQSCMESVAKKFGNLTAFSICGNYKITSLKPILSYLPNLTSLNLGDLNFALNGGMIKPNELGYVADYCTKLKRLGIVGFPHGGEHDACQKIFQTCAQLEHVDFAKRTVTKTDLEVLFKHCKQIKSLSFGNSLMSSADKAFLLKTLGTVYGTNLEELNLRQLTYDYSSRPTDIEAFKGLLAKCPNLICLDISNTSWASEDILQYLATHQLKLQRVMVCGLHSVNSSTRLMLHNVVIEY
jgi:hypothetical protein